MMALVSIAGYAEYCKPSVRLSEVVCSPVKYVTKALLIPINSFKTLKIKVMLRQSVGQSASVSSTHLGPKTRFLLLPDS
jgi:hypothetical protein